MRMLAGIREAVHTPLMFAAAIEVTAHLSFHAPSSPVGSCTCECDWLSEADEVEAEREWKSEERRSLWWRLGATWP